MKIYEVVFFTIGITHIITCFGMDINLEEEQKKIELFVTKLNEQKEKNSIPFLLPMEQAYPEFAKYFPQKKPIPLSDPKQITKNISTKENNSSIQIVKTLNEVTEEEEKSQQKKSSICKKKKHVSSLNTPSVTKTILYHKESDDNTCYRDLGFQKIPINSDKVKVIALNTFNKLSNGQMKNKKNGPYLHKETNIVFAPIDQFHSYAYSGLNKQLIIFQKSYCFPDEETLKRTINIFITQITDTLKQ